MLTLSSTIQHAWNRQKLDRQIVLLDSKHRTRYWLASQNGIVFTCTMSSSASLVLEARGYEEGWRKTTFADHLSRGYLSVVNHFRLSRIHESIQSKVARISATGSGYTSTLLWQASYVREDDALWVCVDKWIDTACRFVTLTFSTHFLQVNTQSSVPGATVI